VQRRRDTEARQGFRAAGRHGLDKFRSSPRRHGDTESSSQGAGEIQPIPQKNAVVSQVWFVKMSYFAIDFYIEIPYPLAPPQGWEAITIFEK
jgi:hypothetical protein